jgi:hypothetical protein
MIIFGGFQCSRQKYRYFLWFLWAAENTETFDGFFGWAVKKNVRSAVFPY